METLEKKIVVKLNLATEEKNNIDMYIRYCKFVSNFINQCLILNPAFFKRSLNSIQKDIKELKKSNLFDFSGISSQIIDNMFNYSLKICKMYLKNKITESEKDKLLNDNLFILSHGFYIKDNKLYFPKCKSGISFFNISNMFYDIKKIKIYKTDNEYFTEIIVKNKVNNKEKIINSPIVNNTDQILKSNKKISLQDICNEYLLNKTKKSYDHLLCETYNILKKYLWTLTKNESIIEDVLHDTIIKIVENINNYNPKWNFSTWAYTICKHMFFSYMNKNKKIDESLTEIDIMDYEYSNDTLSEKKKKEEKYNELEYLINLLPEKYAIIMTEEYINGLKIKDISKKYNISEDMIYKFNAYGKKLIQKITKEKQSNEQLLFNFA